MRNITLFFILLFSSFSAFAYELNGTISDNDNSDGSYTVSVQNNEGHYYKGSAEENKDGTLSVIVSDDKGETYSGTATINQDESYELDLTNKRTGMHATGMLEEG